MIKGESFLERTTFLFNIIIRMIVPPFYSFERLEKYCKACVKKNPRAYFPRSFLAGLYKDYKKNEEAKKEYDEIKLLGYMADDDWLNMGEVLFGKKDYQGVIETLAPIIDKNPRHKNANWFLGISYMKKEDYQNAVVYLERATSTGSKQYEDYWHLGFCYDHLGKLEKANEFYYKALVMKSSLELRQNIASVHVRLAQFFLDTDLERAEIELKKALAIHPDNAEATRILEGIRKIKGIDAKIAEKEKGLTANDSVCTD